MGSKDHTSGDPHHGEARSLIPNRCADTAGTVRLQGKCVSWQDKGVQSHGSEGVEGGPLLMAGRGGGYAPSERKNVIQSEVMVFGKRRLQIVHTQCKHIYTAYTEGIQWWA